MVISFVSNKMHYFATFIFGRYPIPAVSALDLTIGGLVYTAAPFNGWYADTEVLRDLTDECRYNLLVPIAKALGFDTNAEAPLWKDEVMAILNKAIYYSYKKAKVAMVDHHTLINMFYDWYQNEIRTRKFCPVNWKWVIPPMSASTSKAYLGLNKLTGSRVYAETCVCRRCRFPSARGVILRQSLSSALLPGLESVDKCWHYGKSVGPQGPFEKAISLDYLRIGDWQCSKVCFRAWRLFIFELQQRIH
mmetsp:Transcript_20336/g.40821  ORF Transcript_20336/g.40821 Transcript_20336/m.40821 type:complete len:248 (-) Transcript_20336:2058-2801(-)